MKTIFYEQNQINISKKIESGYLHVYTDPTPMQLKFIIDLFLNSNNYNGLIVWEETSILKQIKKQNIIIK